MLIEVFVDLLDVEPLDHLVLVEQHGGRRAAGAEALDLAQRDAAGRRGPAGLQPELLLEVLEDPLAAREAAADVRAKLPAVPGPRTGSRSPLSRLSADGSWDSERWVLAMHAGNVANPSASMCARSFAACGK
mgnify:CR=1 FL=1